MPTNDNKTLLVTGGAGFIGSALIRLLIRETNWHVVNVDKLTYAGNLESLAGAAESERYAFEQVDICDREALARVFKTHQPDAVMHLAAESHVDRSIEGPGEFIQTNVVGTYNLLEQARSYWNELDATAKADFRFHHISTDEVYGDLGPQDPAFTETTSYAPSSPYSASKASSDHLVRAWHRTYGLPVLLTNCSNNYGPCQFPEKLIPLMILNALDGKPLPVYGKGENIRDWLYVDDHARALKHVLEHGEPGRTYNIGGRSERTNLHIVRTICRILDELAPVNSLSSCAEKAKQQTTGSSSTEKAKQRTTTSSCAEKAKQQTTTSSCAETAKRSESQDLDSATSRRMTSKQNTYENLITFVTDRPGHDQRYAIDDTRIATELGWQPQEDLDTGLRRTIQWYLDNPRWIERVRSGEYRDWMRTNYAQREVSAS